MNVWKLFLLSFVAWWTFVSCTRDIEEIAGETLMRISVSVNDESSRASDDPAVDGIKSLYDNLFIYFTDGNRVLFCDVISDTRELEAFRAAGKVYDNVTPSATEVLILANVKPADTARLTSVRVVYDIEDYPFMLVAQQPGALHPENTRAGGLKVTMLGKGIVTEQLGISESGSKKMKAKVTVKPVVARIEIYGTPRPSTGIRSLKVTKVYLNGYYTARQFIQSGYVYEEQNIFTYAGNIAGDATVLSENNLSAGGLPERVDAHHMFSDNKTVGLPHLVFQVEGVYDNGEGSAGIGFSDKYLTVTSYPEAPVMLCGNVYKIDLSLLGVTSAMLDPVPEAGRVSLGITVGIEEWSEHWSSPEL